MKKYNKEHNAKERVNGWGQRITGLVAHGDSLMVGTMAYGAWKRNSKLSFLTDEVWAEYGRVTKLTLPGQIAAHIQWKDGPTKLQFVVTDSKMQIKQDGQLLGETDLPPQLVQRSLQGGQFKFGKGVFGPMAYKLVSKSIDLPTSK